MIKAIKLKKINLKHILLLLLLTVSFTLMANGNSENNQTAPETQRSANLKVMSGDTEIITFKIKRDAKLGEEFISIKGTTLLKSYYVSVVDKSLISTNNSTYTTELNGSDLNIEISNFNNYSSSESILESLKVKSDLIYHNYSPDVITKGVRLISKFSPENSYEFILKINPSIIISHYNTTDTETFIAALKDNPEYKRYLRKQIMGGNSFNSTTANPFPISNIDNEYVYQMNKTTNSNKIEIENKLVKQNINVFDSIYNYSVNNNEELGSSILQKLLRIYFTKNKPLFHNYINDYMKTNHNYFNYLQYEKISPSDGLELVNSALKYLTWGVEYTPNINERDLNTSANIFPSQILKNNTELMKWFDNANNIAGNRVNNYLPAESKNITSLVNNDDPTYNLDKLNNIKSVGSKYFEAGPTLLSNINLTTPFVNGNLKVTGSSLPYVKGGFDSPRTFNFKMLEQFKVISNYLLFNPSSTYYSNNHYFSFTKNGTPKTNAQFYFALNDKVTTTSGVFEVNSTNHQPFYPGKSDDLSYKGTNLTGVDSLGLLTGALSMTSYYHKVLNTNNKPTPKELDNYYQMTTYPTFTNTPNTNISNIRFTREDIERSTVIVSDLNNIQPGDLLVNGTGDDTEIAIIIDSGYTENSTTFNMANVLVLSVNKRDGRVALNYWGNNGTNSSFTLEPKNFIVRRLIKFTGDISDSNVYSFTEYVNETEVNGVKSVVDSWDPLIPGRDPLVATLDLGLNTESLNKVNNSHWIPNTGELYEIKSIKFGTLEDVTFTETVDYDNADVIITAPTDMNYDTTGADDNSSTTGNNILVNKGDGFAFYAINSYTGTDKIKYYDAIRLATFKINTSSTNQYDRYTVEYNDKIFTADGFCNQGYSLKYTNGIGVVFTSGGSDTFTTFAIRPLETNIRPGDDLLLNFDLYHDNTIVPANTRAEDFMAVYDEKMLWRANLYIDEGGSDWNILNPWNAPPVESEANTFGEIIDNGVTKRFYEPSSISNSVNKFNYYSSTNWKVSDNEKVWYGSNEWNRRMAVLNDTDKDNEKVGANNFKYTSGSNRWEDLTDLSIGDGKQVTKIPETYYYNEHKIIENGQTTYGLYKNKKVTNRVVYNYGRTTTPFEFYYQMQQQNQAMKNKEILENSAAEIIALEEAVNIAEKNLANATNENRPNLTLLLRNTRVNLKEAKSIYTEIGENTLAPKGNWQNYITGSFIPSYYDAVKYDFEDSTYDVGDIYSPLPEYPFKDAGSNGNLESGIDCGGLIYASEMYEGTPYMSTNTISAQTGYRAVHDCDTVGIEGNPWGNNQNLWYLNSRSNIFPRRNDTALNKPIIPGDIIYYSENNKYHVMIVQSVELNGTQGSMSSENISVIESTWGINVEFQVELFGVGKFRSLGADYLFGYNWIIGRLKTKE